MSDNKKNKKAPTKKTRTSHKKKVEQTNENFKEFTVDEDNDEFNIDFWKSYIITQQELVNDLVKKNMVLTTEITKLNQVLHNYQRMLNDTKGVQTINKEEQYSRTTDGRKVLNTFKPNVGLTKRTGLSKISKE